MTTIDDPATVLEQFIHDVANLPAEVAHHMEEIQAKDQSMIESRNHISSRDAAIQRHVRNSGGQVKIPAEDKYITAVKLHYEKALALQEEKCLLANKVAKLLDRHVKRYDLQIKELISSGTMAHDPSLPSLLEDSNANLAPISSSTTGFNTPIGAHGSSTTIADLARGRNFPSTLITSGRNSNVAPVAGMSPTVTITNSSAIPAAAASRLRESSQGASDTKRRKLTASLNIPAHPSGLRQSSQGPGAGTPKATTPGASSRAGSAGPARTKKATKKPVPQGALSMRKAVSKRSGMNKKQRRLLSGRKGTPSTNDSSPSDEEMSDDDSVDTASRRAGKDGAADDTEDASAGGHDYDDEGDDTKYCICQQPSHGDMIACDNENCELEWFHWACVKLDKPPVGRWLCPNCRELPKTKVKLAR